jgi:hypothetical protein
MLEQVSLFAELENNNKCFYKNIEKSGFEYEEVNIGDITFKPGQSESLVSSNAKLFSEFSSFFTQRIWGVPKQFRV